MGIALAMAVGCGGDGTGGSGGGGAGPGGSGGAGGDAGGGAGGSGGDGGAAAGVRLMSWDLDGLTPQEADYPAQRAAIGSTVLDFDPDLLIAVDVGSQMVLQQLATNELAGGWPFRDFVQGNHPNAGGIAFASKLPIDDMIDRSADTFGTAPIYAFQRGAIELHLTVGGRHVAVVACRLRDSQGIDDPDQRLAEAQHVRELADAIQDADPSALVVIAGDMQEEAGPAVSAFAPLADAADLVPEADRWTFAGQLFEHHFSAEAATAAEIPHTGAVAVASPHAPLWSSYP